MLGTRIASLRKKAGLSQAELASILHVSPSTVGMYEQGRRAPNYSLLIALSKEFNVSIDYLLTGQCSTENDAISSTRFALETMLQSQAQDKLANLIVSALTSKSD